MGSLFRHMLPATMKHRRWRLVVLHTQPTMLYRARSALYMQPPQYPQSRCWPWLQLSQLPIKPRAMHVGGARFTPANAPLEKLRHIYQTLHVNEVPNLLFAKCHAPCLAQSCAQSWTSSAGGQTRS